MKLHENAIAETQIVFSRQRRAAPASHFSSCPNFPPSPSHHQTLFPHGQKPRETPFSHPSPEHNGQEHAPWEQIQALNSTAGPTETLQNDLSGPN